jgi:cytochrome c biogenesis protein CcmG/thiol:disulfide interchange protein DsbE
VSVLHAVQACGGVINSPWKRRRSQGTAMSVVRYRRFSILLITGLATFVPAFASAPVDMTTPLGRVVYLDFWASWCAPCRKSFPWMQAMKNAYESQGLSIIAVNLDHDQQDADAFLRRYQTDFEVRFDPQGTWAEQFRVSGMPTSVIIDRRGAVRFTHIGFRPGDDEVYARQLRQLLSEH